MNEMNFNQAWLARFGWPNAEDLHLPLAIAHRGASDYRMENTLEAFQLAAELGAEMWELDVRLSKDGVVVVCHDETLGRVAGNQLRIPDATWAEISVVELAGNLRVPRLEEVIELARKTNSGLYIELKAAEAILAAADRALKGAETTKAGLKDPLDGGQNTVLGPLSGWFEAQEQAVHFPKETVLEVNRMKGELEAGRLRWAPSVTARETALKQAEATEKQSAAAHAKNLKDNEALDQLLKEAETADKTQQAKQAAAIKALTDASNNLRDARYRAGAKEREWLEAVFQHESYRVQKRAVLGFE